MKQNCFLFLLPLMILTQGCPKDEIKFIDKEFIIKGSTNKITIKVPTECEKFNTGVKVNVDAMVEYAGQEAQLAANFEKVLLISEFSDRLRAIIAAQCNIVQTSLVIDPNNSDLSFYNDIVKNYTEYQKVRDLLTSNPSTSQKNEITKTILSVYEVIFKNKKDELLDYITNLEILLDVLPGTQVMIYRNNELIGTILGGAESPTKYVIDKKYLLPAPDEIINLKFVASAVGYRPIEKSFSLAELQKQKSDKGFISIDLQSN